MESNTSCLAASPAGLLRHGSCQEAQNRSGNRLRGPKQLVSFHVDAVVQAFFRSMGRGHTTRMAEVLRVFMHARLADVVQGAEGVNYAPEVVLGASRALERMRAVMKRERGR